MAHNIYTILEGDTVILRCHETGDYIFSIATSLSQGKVELHPRSEGDKIYHDDHFAAFQILSDPWDPFISSLKSPLIIPKHEPDNVSMDAIFTSAIYGRKIKLRQVATNMYLSVDSSSDNLKIFKKDDDSCVFKILPAQMESSNEKRRGDRISSGDRVIVESAKKKGYHILNCQRTESKRNNLKIAVTKSTFVIEILCNTKCHKAIREGIVVRLRNIKVDGFLAEAAFDTVSIRKTWNVNGMKRLPPASGDCFWQLEKVNSCKLKGNPVHFEDKCYIKHMACQKYLLVYKQQQDYKLKLDSDHGSQFILSSKEKKNEGEVLNEKIVRLQCLESCIDDNKTFLTVQGDNTLLPKHVHKKSNIGTKLFNVCLNEECDTANFRIEEVTPDHVHSLHFAASIRHVLSEYYELIQSDPNYESDELNEILNELVKYTNKDVNIGAKMLRVYHIVNLLVDVLAKSRSNDIRKKVCSVLECYAKTPSHNLRMYLIKEDPDLNFRELLVKKLGRGLGVENVLSTLVYHDSKIANLLVSAIDSAIESDEHNFDAAVLHLYSSLCFTEGLPNRQLQDKVFTTIIIKRKDIFYKTKVISGEVYIFLPNELEVPGQNQMSLEEHSIPVKKPVLVSSLGCAFQEKTFFIAQLRLFSKVCKGVNETSIGKLKKLKRVSWFDETLIALEDNNIPLEIKSAYLDLVESLYIEPSIHKNGRDIDHLWHCYLWENLVPPDPLKASKVSRYSVDTLEDAANIRALISHIGKKVKNKQVLEPNETHSADNELLAQMLEIMERLAAYAYFWDSSEIEFKFSSLVNTLDGRTDNYPNNNQRYKKDNNEHIFKVKRIAVKLLHVFFKQLSYMACAELLIEFKCRKDGTNHGLDPLLNDSFNVAKLETEVLKEQRKKLRFFFTTQNDDYKCFNIDDPEGLVVILQDLMCYEDDELRICSANLLYAIYKKEHKLFEDAKWSYIHIAGDQRDPTQYSIYDQSMKEGHLRNESKLKTLVDATNPTGDLPMFIKELKNTLLFIKNEVCPRPNYQYIVYTTGVYSALLIFVFKHFSKDYDDGPEKDKIKELLVDVCDVLQKICRGNKLVQQKIFFHFTDFYDVKIAISSVAYLLTEIITDRIELCRDFSEEHIRQLYILACTGTSNETKEYLDFFTTLEAVMKPSKGKSGPLLINYQEKIAKMLNESFQYKDNFFSLMFKDKANERLTVLLKYNPNDNVRLLTLLNVSSLLATCAEGRGKFAETLCHKIFTIKELISILVIGDVPRQRKVPFARLLNEGCIYSEKYSVSSLHELKNSDFWKHIVDCTSFINDHIVTLRNKRYTEKFMFLFKRLFSEHISWTKVWKLDDDSSTEEISFGLLYFVDGIIPLVTSFCDNLGSDLIDDLQQEKLKQFGDAVLKLVVDEDLAPIFLTCEAHVLFWRSCFNSISKLFPNEFKHKIAASKIGQRQFEYPKLETEITEKQLNELFQQFIINYQEVYEVNEQKTQDSDEKSECSTQLLPGGRSFKCLVDLFTDADSTKFKRNIKKASDMLGVLYSQLYLTYDSIKRNQLNADLCTTLQLLHGVLSRFTCSERRSKEKIEDLEEIYQKTASLLVLPSDDVAVLALYVILDLCKCDQEKTAKLVTASDENFFLRLYKLLSTAISWFSDDSSVQKVAGTHEDQQEEEEEEPGHSVIYYIGQLEVTETEAVQHLTIVLKLIISMCSGQITDMQNILRHQEHNISINIVGEVTKLLQAVVENKKPNISVITMTIQTLIEICSGNHENQNVAINGQVVDSINQILKHPAPKWDHYYMQCKALELLEILLEETSSDPAACQDTGRAVAKDIDVSVILAKMDGFYIYKSTDHDKEEIIDIATIRTYHILRKSADYLRKPLSEYVPDFDETSDRGKYVKDSTCHIEVNYTDSIEDTSNDKAILTSVYFRYVSEKLTEGQKTEIQNNINRDSLEDKAKDLLKWANSVDKILKYREEKLEIKSTSRIEKLSGPLRLLLNFLTILLNIIVLSVVRISDRSITIGSNSSLFFVLYPETSNIPYQVIYRLLAILHLILSIFMVIKYFLFKYPNFTLKIPLLMNLLYEVKLWLRQLEKFKDNKNLNWINKPPKNQCFDINFWGIYTTYHFPFVLCSFLGVFFSGYFYCFCLPYIFIKSELLNHVIKAVQAKLVQLVLVILLILSIILIYAAISFAFFSNFFNPEPGDNLFCQSLFECYITIIREGLLNSLRTIPTNRVGQEYPSFEVYLGRSFIDLTFFIIVSVIGLGVIIAILIDRFYELRTKRDAAEKDKKDFCFICGIDSDQFEKCGISFEDHCRDDHNMYNYMYFIHHVKSKKPKDHNAIEKYVYDCVSGNPGSIKFLPLRKAKKLGGKVFTKDQNTQFDKWRKQYWKK